MTIPIGAWKAKAGTEGAIAFEPELPEKRRALERIEMGRVVKIVLRFREMFWDEPGREAGGERRPGLGFLLAPGALFPTWWSAAPVEAPVLTGWAGGPAASALASLPEEELAGRASASIASLLGVSRRRVASLLEAWRMHDWQADPFSRGAYSYLAPGGVPARRALARSPARSFSPGKACTRTRAERWRERSRRAAAPRGNCFARPPGSVTVRNGMAARPRPILRPVRAGVRPIAA